MNKEQEKFIQNNSPDGGFLQSDDWKNFQEAVGNKTLNISSQCFDVNLIEHRAPLVGKYLYAPRGPVFDMNCKDEIANKLTESIDVAKKEGAGWIRIDVESREKLEMIKSVLKVNVSKAPQNVQPEQIFVIDIDESIEDIMADMKPKTRYNIRLAKKKGVEIESVSRGDEKMSEYLSEFLRLTDIMTNRSGIRSHSKRYYEKMIQSIPQDRMRLYVAKFEGRVIAAALVSFFGGTATYLHGGSDNEFRNVMAPFLLHWQVILDAKQRGCEKYDLGGVKTSVDDNGKIKIDKSSWEGITRFKLGFSKSAKPLIFSGSYDIVLGTLKYIIYRFLRKVRRFF